MINFRYHLVSLIAVFLALGIGVIVGTAVIDSAVVDRLEAQQRGLEADIDDVRAENRRLRNELAAARDGAAQLAEEGSQRLLDGALAGVPVVTVAAREAEARGFEDLRSLLSSADAEHRGTIWLTDRFRLDDDGEVDDLAEALAWDGTANADSLRSAAVDRLADALRPGAGAEQQAVLVALRETGFVDIELPEGAAEDAVPVVGPETRIVVGLAGPASSLPARRLAAPLVRDLVLPVPGEVPVPVVVVTAGNEDDGEGDDAEEPGFVEQLRDDETLAPRLSTVDNLEDFAGRLAAVLAIADAGTGRTGHYGRQDGAQRLLPAPSA